MINELSKDMDAKIRASFMMLMQGCLDLKVHDGDFFGEIKEAVIQTATGLTTAADLNAYRETVIAALKNIYTFKAYFNLADEWTGYTALYKRASNFEGKPVAGEILFKSHIKTLVEKDPNRELNMDTLSDWMSFIPLRMATARYMDYVTDGVKSLPMDVNTLCAEDFNRSFYPPDYCKDEKWLQEIKEHLDDIWENDGDFDKNIGRLKDINQRMITITVYASTLYDALCAAIITLKAGERGIGLLSEPEIKTLHDSFLDAVKQPERDEDFSERLDKAAVEAMDKVQFDNLEEMETGGFDEETLAMYEEWLPVHEMYFETSFDYFAFIPKKTGKNTSVTNGEKEFFAEIAGYMNTKTQNIGNKRKRFLRQHFLKYLPYPYELEDYKDYFLETYAGLDAVNQNMLAIIMIGLDSMER
jgi:hypothetical protein